MLPRADPSHCLLSRLKVEDMACTMRQDTSVLSGSNSRQTPRLPFVSSPFLDGRPRCQSREAWFLSRALCLQTVAVTWKSSGSHKGFLCDFLALTSAASVLGRGSDRGPGAGNQGFSQAVLACFRAQARPGKWIRGYCCAVGPAQAALSHKATCSLTQLWPSC